MSSSIGLPEIYTILLENNKLLNDINNKIKSIELEIVQIKENKPATPTTKTKTRTTTSKRRDLKYADLLKKKCSKDLITSQQGTDIYESELTYGIAFIINIINGDIDVGEKDKMLSTKQEVTRVYHSLKGEEQLKNKKKGFWDSFKGNAEVVKVMENWYKDYVCEETESLTPIVNTTNPNRPPSIGSIGGL